MADIADLTAESVPIQNVANQDAPWYGMVTGNFVVRRILRAVLTIFFVTTLIFFLVRLLPGDPVQVYINQQMTQYGYSYEDAKNQAMSLYAIDVDKSLPEPIRRLHDGCRPGRPWQSLTNPGSSVISIINSRIWWTMFSVGTALIISFAVGVAAGDGHGLPAQHLLRRSPFGIRVHYPVDPQLPAGHRHHHDVRRPAGMDSIYRNARGRFLGQEVGSFVAFSGTPSITPRYRSRSMC